jgi:hypothetical protein
MKDVTVADWACLVVARVELQRAERGLDDVRGKLPVGEAAEPSPVSAELDHARGRVQAAQDAHAAAARKARDGG